jgi:hypothetical protein
MGTMNSSIVLNAVFFAATGDWLLISGTTNCTEKLILILLIIFLNGVGQFCLGGGVGDGGRQVLGTMQKALDWPMPEGV